MHTTSKPLSNFTKIINKKNIFYRPHITTLRLYRKFSTPTLFIRNHYCSDSHEQQENVLKKIEKAALYEMKIFKRHKKACVSHFSSVDIKNECINKIQQMRVHILMYYIFLVGLLTHIKSHHYDYYMRYDTPQNKVHEHKS